ncbi:MAG: arylamine N-acetyltransferase [Thermoanaerobaculales bacterium]|nr:arylamine N-acetyltransferase [Thermoanaerobaculales bacterium]
MIDILGGLEEIPFVTTPEIFERYLSILEVEPEPPSLDHLRRLVRAQLTGVPFENISKLYLKKTRGASYIPSLDEHLDGVERFHFGGTCYANNAYFARLLSHCGYDVDLCGADMTRPDVHVVSVVRLEGHEYLVDVGYGAPFFEPMALDLDQTREIVFGGNRYVLHPQDRQGRSRLDQVREGKLIHGYIAKPEPREIDHFAEVIRDSYSDAATFMNVIVVERFFPNRSVRIHNFTLTESTPNAFTTTQLSDRKELVDAIEHHCGFPSDMVREAIADIALEADIYS